MGFDFDGIVERRNTNSLKYDFAVARGMPEDILPLWVADMDFPAPPSVLEALRAKVDHGIFGYSDSDDAYFAVLEDWFSRRFGWKVQPEWLVKTPGIVTAIHMAILALTQPGDSVIIQQPVYYPFAGAIKACGRKLVDNPLCYEGGRYTMDLADFEQKVRAEEVKLFILCSPHNPVGRVWTREELEQVGDICLRHGVTVIADEIHQDFVYAGHQHQVFAGIRPEFRDMTITCTAPSKTFNLAGLNLSNIWIPDQEKRKAFERECTRSGHGHIGIMGVVACQAAYSGGEQWLEALKVYLQENIRFVREFLAAKLPGVDLVEPEGTYLVWLDCRRLGLDTSELNRRIVHQAGVWLDDGPMFGVAGAGFQRVNVACPRKTLEQAMERLAAALG